MSASMPEFAPEALGPRTDTPLLVCPRVGIVLAAGRSERLSGLTGGGSKALLRIGGVSLVERAVRRLLRLGLERVVVVVGYHAGVVATVIDHLELPSVQTVFAERWEQGNGASLGAAEPYLGGETAFALVTTDHIFGEGSLEPLLASGVPAALIDQAPAADAWSEGTRVVLRGKQVVGLSKAFDTPAIDCGAFVLPMGVFDAQRQASDAGDASLAGAISALVTTHPLRAVPLAPDGWCIDVDTPEDARRAQRALRSSLVRASDGPVSRYVNRPISTRLSMALAPLRISPDLLSLLALMLGLASALALGAGLAIAGAILAAATSILDGVDGESARLQQRDGPQGALLDGVLDRVTDTAIIAGLAVWSIYLGVGDAVVIVLAVAATSLSVLSMATKDRIKALSLPAAPERTIGHTLGGRDGRLLLVTVAALAGAPFVGLVAVVVTGSLGLLARILWVRRSFSSSRAGSDRPNGVLTSPAPQEEGRIDG
jgi:choline kinase/phosphatidylglycerophosphate synthase